MSRSIEELRELAPGYVMGTLSLEERRAFDQAMGDPSIESALESELAVHRAAVDYLAAAQPVTPPASLRDRVAARIAQEKAATGPVLAADTPEQAKASSAPALAPTVNVPAITPNQGTRTVSGGGRRLARWSAIGLGVALAASLVFTIDVSREVKSLRGEIERQTAMLTQTQGQLAERDKTLATVLGTGDDVTLVRLQPNQPRGPGMQVFWNRRQGRAIVSASGLAQLSRDRAYALWMIRDNKPVAIALFSPDASGHAVVPDIAVPTDPTGIAAFAVTEEPSTGSPQPTMTPFLVGAVPKG